MAEEFDPLQKMGQGNAYDGLFAGRVSKLKKAAAETFPIIGGLFFVYFMYRLIVAVASLNSSTQRIEEIQRTIDDLQRRSREGFVIPKVPVDVLAEREPANRTKILRLQIAVEKKLIADSAPGFDCQKRQQRLGELDAELKQLEAGLAGVAPIDPDVRGIPNFVGPPEELKGSGKKGNP